MESQQIREAGLKVTAPRVKILHILETSDKRHLSAEDVYRELIGQDAEIGLATVYRVLTQFEAAGLVCRRHFEGGQALFELNRGHHHDHLICVKCGEVVEFTDRLIEDRQASIAAEHHFEIEDHSLVIYGVCPRCQEREVKRRAKS
ncbi:MAG: ferric iron uptake transcriptional regulator [Chromatiaceae bacterium]|nr:ferric iron uptake transcriptional regulator [Chromatiaceae bacterium]